MSPLLELLLRASILLLVGLCLWLLARNKTAESRVLLLRGTLAGLAVLPALWAVGPRWIFDMPGMAKPQPVILDFDVDMMTAAPSTIQSASRVDLLPLIYIGVALLILFPAAIGYLILRRLWSRAEPLDWQLEDELSEALDTVGVRHKVEGRIGGVGSPLVFGCLHRRILLPDAFRTWPEDHRRSALLHEASHLIRFDCAWQHLAHGVRAVYWCHPLVWFLSRALKDETELAADERAIRSGAEAADYASALVAIARALQEPGRLVRSQGVTFMNHRQLDRRVRSVLHGRRRGFAASTGLAMAAFAALGTFFAAGANPQKPVADVVLAPRLASVEVPLKSAASPPVLLQEINTKEFTIIAQSGKIQVPSKEHKGAPAVTVRVVAPNVRSSLAGVAVQGMPSTPAQIARAGAAPKVAASQPATTSPAPTPGQAVAPADDIPRLPQKGSLKPGPFNAAPRSAAPAGSPFDPFSAPAKTTAPASNPFTYTIAPLTGRAAPAVAHPREGAHLAPAIAFPTGYKQADEQEILALLEHAKAVQNEDEVMRALQMLQKLKLDTDREIEAIRKILEGARKDGKDAVTTRALLDRVYTARPVTGTVTNPLTFRNSIQLAPRKFDYVKSGTTFAPLLTGARTFQVQTGSDKPITITVSVDGKMHELKVKPGKDGVVRIEVDAKGNVRTVGGTNPK